MALSEGKAPQTSVLERERVAEYYEEQRYIVRWPVPRYYAILVGLVLTPLGVLGFIPQFTRGGLLFNILRVSLIMSGIYILTGIAGIVAGTVRKGHYAPLFTLILTGVYLILFSSGNIAFGNFTGSTGGPPDVHWILENALHAGLMLTGALITGLAALQHGDRATTREFAQEYGLPTRLTHNESSPNRDIARMLEMLSLRRLSRGKTIQIVLAVVLLTLGVAALALYYFIENIVKRYAGAWPF